MSNSRKKKKSAKNKPAPTRLRYDDEVSDVIPGKQMRTADPAAKGGVVLPQTTDEDIKLAPDDPHRFIKTGETPFVSVRADTLSQEGETEMNGFADRLVTPAAQKRVHTGFTGKLNTYETLHAADGARRMITPAQSEEPPAPQEEAPGAEAAAEAQTPSLFSDFLEEKKSAAALTEASLRGGDAAPKELKDALPQDLPEVDFSLPEDGETAKEADGPADDAPEQAPAAVEEKGSLLRELAGTAEEDVRRNPDRMMMDAASSAADAPAGAPEQDAAPEEPPAGSGESPAADGEGAPGDSELQQELEKVRKDKVDNFQLTDDPADPIDGPREPDAGGKKKGAKKRLPAFLRSLSAAVGSEETPFTPVDAEEYTRVSDHRDIFSRLLRIDNLMRLKTALLAAMGVLLLILDFTVRLSAEKNGGVFLILGGSAHLYGAVNLVFVLAAAGILFGDIRNGALNLLKVTPHTDTSLLFVLAAAAAQSITGMFTKLALESEAHLLAPAAILVCVPYILAKRFYYDNTRQCFKVLSSGSEKSVIRKVTDKEFRRRVLRDKSPDGSVMFAGKTKFISGFLGRSAVSAASGMTRARTVPIAAGVSLLAAVLGLILSGSFMIFISVLTLALLCSFPVSCLTATGFFLSRENRKLSVKSSYIQSYDDAKKVAGIDNITADAAQLFNARVMGCMTADGVSEKQASFAAAALAAKSESVIRKAFAPAIRSFGTILPQAEELTYEDRLGLSAWINGNRVLLGTRELLVNHSVEPPQEEKVNAFLKNGEKPIYLAIEGHFAAVFSAVYAPVPDVRNGIRDLIASGAALLIGTTDANITEAFAERLLGLDQHSVRIIGYAESKKLAQARGTVRETESTGVVFTEAFSSLCRCAAAAVRLDSIRRRTQTICTAGIYIALGVVGILTGASYTRFGNMIPLLVQALLLAVCFIVPILLLRLKQDEAEADAPARGQEITLPETDVEDLEEKYRKRFEEMSRKAAESKDPPVLEETQPPKPQADAPAKASPTAAEDGAENAKTADEAFEEISEKGTEDLFSKTAQSALDHFADTPQERARQRARQAKKEKNADRRTAAEEGMITSSDMKKTFSELDGFVEQLAGNKTFGGNAGGAFSLYGAAGPDRRSAEEIENDYLRRKASEEKVRSTFTAPEMTPPGAGKRSARDKEIEAAYKAIEVPENVPPAGSVDVFDDAFFRRFEDDKIFAGLKDEADKKKYDF